MTERKPSRNELLTDILLEIRSVKWLLQQRAQRDGLDTNPEAKAARIANEEKLAEGHREFWDSQPKPKAEPKPDPNKPDLNIYLGNLPKVDPTVRILEFVEGKGWKPASLTEAERAAEEKRLQEEATGFVEIPKAEW